VLRALALPAVSARLRALGVEARGSTPEELGGLLASETRRWRGVIERAGIEKQ
jgi:tripartite-type tricarboxylate transporter receptor subunit TctC